MGKIVQKRLHTECLPIVSIDDDWIRVSLCRFRMVLSLVHNNDPPKALQWDPLVDIPKVGEVVSQHGQDQGVKK